MKDITYHSSLFDAKVYGVGVSFPKDIPLADPFLVVAGAKAQLGVSCSDEIPLFFAAKGVLGAAKIGLENAINGEFAKDLHAAITQYNLDPRDIQIYMGPCLTFSHTHVERKLLERLMDEGYRAACKRTDGVDFVDIAVLILMQCRKRGILMENIHIGDYDTFENPDLLYSKLRGDKEENLVVATLN